MYDFELKDFINIQYHPKFPQIHLCCHWYLTLNPSKYSSQKLKKSQKRPKKSQQNSKSSQKLEKILKKLKKAHKNIRKSSW